jgi:Transposase DDE domain
MFHTPFFSALRPRLAPMGSRTARAVKIVRSFTLCQLEKCLGPWVPTDLFPKASEKANSRDHHYTRWRTFWCMLWQSLNPNASGREVVRQLQALFILEDGPELSEEDGAYCRARARLPLEEFPKVLAAPATNADQLAPALTLLQGRPIKGADGSSVTLPDLPKNRAAYPPVQRPKGPSFPMMRLVVLWSLVSGAICALAHGSLQVSELSLLTLLTSQLARGDILLGDRGFGNYALIALLQHTLGVDFVGRPKRQIDGRHRRKRLGRNDWLIEWKKGAKASPWLSLAQWAGLPRILTLRAVKGSLYKKGYRVRQVTVVTTLLDPQLYPAQEILQAYLRRWRLEMCLDDIKTTLQMERLRCHSPKMCQKEVFTRLIAHNLIRCTMAQAAVEHDVPLDQISFKGSLDAVRQFSQAAAQARSKHKRQELWAELLKVLASDLLPDRPGRRRTARRQKEEKQIPAIERSTSQIPRPSQAPCPPQNLAPSKTRPSVSAIPRPGRREDLSRW